MDLALCVGKALQALSVSVGVTARRLIETSVRFLRSRYLRDRNREQTGERGGMKRKGIRTTRLASLGDSAILCQVRGATLRRHTVVLKGTSNQATRGAPIARAAVQVDLGPVQGAAPGCRAGLSRTKKEGRDPNVPFHWHGVGLKSVTDRHLQLLECVSLGRCFAKGPESLKDLPYRWPANHAANCHSACASPPVCEVGKVGAALWVRSACMPRAI